MISLNVAFELSAEVTEFDHDRASMRLELPVQTMTVADLIAQAVTTQVMLRRLARGPSREFLDADEVQRQKVRGRVALESDRASMGVAQAIARAQQAFAEGRYRMVLDGAWLSDLDEPVELSEDGTLVFLRLTPLVGG